MNRRGFLGSILALGAAPAIVRADSLMRIVPREARIIHGPTEILTADGWMGVDLSESPGHVTFTTLYRQGGNEVLVTASARVPISVLKAMAPDDAYQLFKLPPGATVVVPVSARKASEHGIVVEEWASADGRGVSLKVGHG